MSEWVAVSDSGNKERQRKKGIRERKRNEDCRVDLT